MKYTPHKELERTVAAAMVMNPLEALPIAEEYGIDQWMFQDAVSLAMIHAVELINSQQVKGIRYVDLFAVTDVIKRENGGRLPFPDSLLDEVSDSYVSLLNFPALCDQLKGVAMARRLAERCAEAIEESKAVVSCEDALAVSERLASRLEIGGQTAEKTGADLQSLIGQQIISWKESASGRPLGIPSRWESLNQVIGTYRFGKLVAVGGYQASGKSLYMVNEAAHFAGKLGVPTLILSLEMGAEEVAGRIVAEKADTSTFKLDIAKGDTADWGRIEDAQKRLEKWPLFIEHGNLSLEKIASKTEKYIKDHGVKAVFIDYIQLIHAAGKFSNRNEELSKVCRVLALLALSKDIVLIVLSQFNRDSAKAFRRPRLVDFKDCGSIEQQARLAILISQKEGAEQVAVRDLHGNIFDCDQYIFDVAKHNGGPTGEVDFTRINARQRWIPVKEVDYFSVRNPVLNPREEDG